MKTTHRIISIAWAQRLDNATDFAKRMGVQSFCIYYQPFELNYLIFVPIRYFIQSIQTWKLLLQKKPELVFITNPPIILVLNVYIYCQLFDCKYLLETHSPALYSLKWGWSVPLLRFFARNALLNTLDQERFKNLFESWGAEAIVLAKMPRRYQLSEVPVSSDGRFSISVVNTFAPDEPLRPILEAARYLPDVHFYIMGDYRLADKNLVSDLPENITLTGWLSHDEYWDQLKKSRAVMTLTTYEYSIVAGGTDGMAVGRPLLLSNQPALKDYFSSGTVFVENCCDSIVAGVRNLQKDENRYKNEINLLADEKIRLWELKIKYIQNIVVGI